MPTTLENVQGTVLTAIDKAATVPSSGWTLDAARASSDVVSKLTSAYATLVALGAAGAVPVEPGVPVAKDVEKLALNGAQVTALQGVLLAVSLGTMPAEAARLLILNSFPAIPEEDAAAMVDSAAATAAARPNDEVTP